MECTRCHGFMMKELVYELLENDGQSYVSGRHWGYRCVVCGKVSDWVIEQNRQGGGQSATHGRAHKERRA